jgi:hypothetical protein
VSGPRITARWWLWRGPRVFSNAVLVPLVVLLLSPNLPSLSAQGRTHWVIPATVGYGGLGCAAGYVATTEAIRMARDQGGLAPLRALGTALGCWSGARVGFGTGAEADSLLGQGQRLETSHRRGVQLGTVLAVVTLGSLVSLIPVGRQDGRNAEIITTYALVGAAAGAVLQVALNRYLFPRGSPPAPRAGVTPEGGFAFGVVCRF